MNIEILLLPFYCACTIVTTAAFVFGDLFSNMHIFIWICNCRVDAEFSAKARIQMLADGSTAIVAVIHESKIFVGNGT